MTPGDTGHLAWEEMQCGRDFRKQGPSTLPPFLTLSSELLWTIL